MKSSIKALRQVNSFYRRFGLPVEAILLLWAKFSGDFDKMWDILLVGAGGFLGAQARFGVSNVASRKWGTEFPYGTVIINLSGSLLLGLFSGLAGKAIFSDEAYRWLVAVGFCGGYTTFSTYTFETLTLFREKKVMAGVVANLVGSYVLGLAAAFCGFWLGNIF